MCLWYDSHVNSSSGPALKVNDQLPSIDGRLLICATLMNHVTCKAFISDPFHCRPMYRHIMDGPFGIQGGGGLGSFLKKIVCFPTGAKK